MKRYNCFSSRMKELFSTLNGKSRSKDSASTIDISFENIDSKNKDVQWQIQNDPTSAKNKGKPAPIPVLQMPIVVDATSGIG